MLAAKFPLVRRYVFLFYFNCVIEQITIRAFLLQRSTWAAKGLAVGYGILSYLVVFLVKYLPGVLEVSGSTFW